MGMCLVFSYFIRMHPNRCPIRLILLHEVGRMSEKSWIKWWYPLLAVVLLAIVALAGQGDAEETEAQALPPVLVIDPGHGGADGGAVAADGTTESGINLDIALRLRALARFWGVETVMTRESEDIAYPDSAGSIAAKKVADQHARVGLVNNTPGAVLLSIHQNNYPAAAPNGIQVFYGKTDGGKDLAEIAQGNLTALLCPENRRLATPIDRDIYLMKNVDCPAVLVECGFLSNPGDLDHLKTDTYRMELAAVLLGSYLQYIRGTVT